MRSRRSRQYGQGMTEYVIILVAIAVVCIAIAVQFGGKVQDHFTTASEEMEFSPVRLKRCEC